MAELFEFISNIDISMANAIRKTIISHIPIVVIDTVIIKENDSNLNDEMIAHRLGLIPLRKTTTEPIPEFKIKLDEIGPKTVYSKDIVFSSGIEAVSPDIILLNLGENEVIKLTGVTEEGTVYDQDHAKFSVSCGTTYKKLENNLILFKIETTGSIGAKDALLKAIQIIKEDLTFYKKLV